MSNRRHPQRKRVKPKGKSRSKKRSGKVQILKSPVVDLRPPSSSRDEIYIRMVEISDTACKSMKNFSRFDASPGIGSEKRKPLFHTNHAILVSEFEGGDLGYLTFVDVEEISTIWPFPAHLQHPKIIAELKQGWYDLEWSRKYSLSDDEILAKDWCMLNQIWVNKEHRGRGVAKILLDNFFNHCESKDALPVVDQPNLNFRKLASRVGQNEGESWFHYVSNLIVPKKYNWKGEGPTKQDLNSNLRLIEWQYNDGNIPGFLPPGI